MIISLLISEKMVEFKNFLNYLNLMGIFQKYKFFCMIKDEGRGLYCVIKEV